MTLYIRTDQPYGPLWHILANGGHCPECATFRCACGSVYGLAAVDGEPVGQPNEHEHVCHRCEQIASQHVQAGRQVDAAPASGAALHLI